jgi:hypothetical protein
MRPKARGLAWTGVLPSLAAEEVGVRGGASAYLDEIVRTVCGSVYSAASFWQLQLLACLCMVLDHALFLDPAKSRFEACFL